MTLWSHHLHALLLAVASSTDNFAVGVSEGVKRKSNPIILNAVVATCNAFGALVASFIGQALSQSAIQVAPLLASTAFFSLGWMDFQETNANYDQSRNVQQQLSLTIALPMTLNNLAGGVAGGATKLIPPHAAFFYALVASLVAMGVGYSCGLRLSKQWKNPSQLSNFSACIYFALGLLSLYDILLP